MIKTIFLGGGCFWCTEAIFQQLRGVEEVTPGYMGGTVKNPSYEMVSTGESGHAEVIKVRFDDQIISITTILDVFFATHDPTTVNQQGADQGTQYRSIVFYEDMTMREEVVEGITRAQGTLPEGKKVVTEVAEQTDFYPAQQSHYNYYALHRDAPYCQVVIDPKIEKLTKRFGELLTNIPIEL